jgi:hypothetical protein
MPKKQSKLVENFQIFGGLAFFILLIFSSISYLLDDSPSLVFVQQELKRNGAIKILKVFDRSEHIEGYGRHRTLKYTYRGFRIEKELELKGEKVLHRIEGSIRCYPEYRSWNPLSGETEEDFCQFHVDKRTPLTEELKP